MTVRPGDQHESGGPGAQKYLVRTVWWPFHGDAPFEDVVIVAGNETTAFGRIARELSIFLWFLDEQADANDKEQQYYSPL